MALRPRPRQQISDAKETARLERAAEDAPDRPRRIPRLAPPPAPVIPDAPSTPPRAPRPKRGGSAVESKPDGDMTMLEPPPQRRPRRKEQTL